MIALSRFMDKSLDLMRHLITVILGCVLLAGGALQIVRGEDKPIRRALPVQTFPNTPTQQASGQGPVLRRGVADDPTGAAGLRLYPAGAPDTIAGSAMMIDGKTGAVIYFKDPDVRRPVASTQKLLTALIIIQSGSLDRTDRVITSDCQVEPTKLGFRAGDTYTNRQLLGALLIHSCNDAAVCLARNEAGSVAAFAQQMNAKAFALGATQSHFVNPNGLPVPGQYSTARDMARIAFVAYHAPVLREYMRMPGFTFTYNSGRQRYFEATNKLIGRSPMFTGMKTGYTGPSGRCLVSSASNGSREVILVQLGGTHHVIFDDAQRMLLWGLNRSSVGSSVVTN
jgi:D-alanyl-D-alanine carboxypeptidase (penicillin-binding protein 5/6)